MKKSPGKLLWPLILMAAMTVVFVPAVSAQEADVERVLSRGDASFEKNDYTAAIVAYFEAAALSTKQGNLSRAYFGLSLCYFYQRDMAESVKWMRKIALVDPYRQISADAYPKPFVDLFNQVLSEARVKGTPVAASKEKVEPPPAVTTRNKVEEQKREEPRAAVEAPRIPSTLPADSGWLGGRLEVSAHIGNWTVDPIKAFLEDDLSTEFGGAIQDEINDELNKRYPGLAVGPFTSDMAFDSQGSNFGLELRYYVRGRAGMFSLGLSLEKTNIKFTLDGSARQEFTNGGVAVAEAAAKVETKPFSTHISFRWEMGRPTARVKPFFTFGLGFAPLKGTFKYDYFATYTLGSASESIQDAQTKTFPELSEDLEFELPDFLLIFQLNFGLKIEIVEGLFIVGEAGFWDGLLIRGGLGYRF